MSTNAVELSPIMSKANRLLRKNKIFLSQKKGLAHRDTAWNQGLSVEWHGRKRLGNRKSHRVSITFSHGEDGATVEVFDLYSAVSIFVCQSI